MSEPLWTAREIAAATGGVLSSDFIARGVSIDTRSLEPGDLFVALAGVRDGHEFVAQALGAGASGSLVARPVEGPSVQVDDTLAALARLGIAARERAAGARRGAVTGSVGKTSVTQVVRAGLDLAGPAHGSVKSYNNHIGVPLTLARMPADTRRAVFEIGMNHAEEIRPLTRMVRPHAAVITTVGPVHTENFPDGEAGVARAKAEIFDGLAPGGIAILNADNSWRDFLAGEARKAGASIWWFGRDDSCDARLEDFQASDDGAAITASLHGRRINFPIRQTGAHWGPNSLAALLLLEALDVDLETGLAALAAFEPLSGRGAEMAAGEPGRRFTLVDESYNANPVSMAAAIAALGARKAQGRRIAVLTDMLELGPEAPAYHAALAKQMEDAAIDLVFCAGALMKSLWDALPPTRRGGYAESAAELAPQVIRAAESGDFVMVKGSLGSKASVVVQALQTLGARATGVG